MFGGLMSTSNEIVEQNAMVISDKPVLWTVEIRGGQEEISTKFARQPIRRHKKVDLP